MLKTYTVGQSYNCLHWRTVVVRAESVEQAVQLANEAGPYDDKPDGDGAAGVISCGEWSADGGGAECGPTFTERVIEDEHENAFDFIASHFPIPVLERQFPTEWTDLYASIVAVLDNNDQTAIEMLRAALNKAMEGAA